MPEIKNLGSQLLYATPGALALLFAGPAFYMSELDPIVREQLPSTKQQLQHWSKMYDLGLRTQPVPALLGSVAAVVAYYRSSEKYWLYGAAALFAVIPYTFLAIMPTNKQLKALLKESDGRDGLEAGKAAGAIEGMKRWVKLHRVRALLALGAAGLFFVARELTQGKAQ